MTEHDELSRLIAALRGQSLAIGIDDVPRIAAVLHHTRGWARERRVRALRTLVGRSAAEREQFDHVAPLLLEPRSTAVVQDPRPARPDEAASIATAEPRRGGSGAARPSWPLVASGVMFAAAIALLVHAVWPDRRAAPIDAGGGSAPTAPDAGSAPSAHPAPADETRQALVGEPSPLPAAFRGIAEVSGVASLVLIGWSLLTLRSRRRRAAAIDRLARSPGRRTVRLTADPAALQPLDRGTIAALAHLLAVPEVVDRETTLDPDETIEQTVRNAGRLTLCFAHEHEQPRLVLVEDVSRSMERWPAHATQLARALEAQGQPVERRYIAGDPLELAERRSVDGRAARLEEVAADARVVFVSDAAHFDREPAHTPRHARALERTIWLSPRPAELWRGGARWLAGCAVARPIGAAPSSLALPAALPAEWRPPRPYADPGETADAWRSALGDDAYLALAVTALLDLVASWNAALVWALISEGVLAPPWQRFERIWDLPELAILPGGRIRLAPELRDRLLADVRRERPELVQRVAAWIDTRLAAGIGAAGADSLGAAIGEVYRDRVARAAGIAGAGARVRQLAQRGLAPVIAAQVSGDEREAWGVRDPVAGWRARLRAPLLGLALLGTIVAGIASAVVPAQRDVWRSVPIVASGDVDAPADAYRGDARRGAWLDSPPQDVGPVDTEPAPPDGDAGDGAQEIVIAGAQTYDRDTVIRARRVTIADGARLRVRHGAMLRIEADEITVQGAAEIDGTGDRGAPGRPGRAEPGETVPDRDRFEKAKQHCQKARPDGRPGGNGGPGATIVLKAPRIEARGLTVRVDGGAGGEGGRGASGHRIEWSEEPVSIPVQQFQPAGSGNGAPASQVDNKPLSEGGEDGEAGNPPTKGAKAPATKGVKAKQDAAKDAKEPAAKRSSPAPLRHRPPLPGRASRPAPTPDRSLVPQSQVRRRDSFKCPDGMDGAPGAAGPRGSFSKSSPDDTGDAVRH
ncbi:MAG TPA: hypothetical protein VHT91_38075 [Kofleriaceae bacterium]|jgi:hypothetical protein|nr:hypothetical protein [Kofleriaceae bacterium]